METGEKELLLPSPVVCTLPSPVSRLQSPVSPMPDSVAAFLRAELAPTPQRWRHALFVGLGTTTALALTTAMAAMWVGLAWGNRVSRIRR